MPVIFRMSCRGECCCPPLRHGKVQFLAVNLDRDLDEARAFLREHTIGYPSATDPEGRLPETYQVKKMPTSFLIDRSGIVRYVHSGFKRDDVDILHRRIKQMLEQP